MLDKALAVLREFCQDVQTGGPNIEEEWPDLYQTYLHAQEVLTEAKEQGVGLRSHDLSCPQHVGSECTCGAFEHNEKVYGE